MSEKINEFNPFFEIDGKEHCDEESALVLLLKDDVLFSNSRDYLFDEKKSGHTVVLFVNCSDIFAWGCADAEDLPHEQIPTLYKMHTDDRNWGAIKWCCIQRNEQPQKPVADDMKTSGAWDDVMEKLSENRYDQAYRERYPDGTQETKAVENGTSHQV